ncbi:hypothetical protein FE374_01620 [Georgenia yuyongxinii]|uniref:Uncharacterized protein n=1 Tax=Georgenia yuyongxinii TaxID=2589797 RepID=A0A5B8C1W3_9MICO|nr:hypothetical protein [Georgenia yuyongxinii]QDC23501.1 hypothetical protein FE374_01620 [Georgenia yuyongxinii]
MTATTTTRTAPAITPTRRRLAAVAALLAAAALLGDVAVSMVDPAALDDHSQGLGRVSEGLVGVAFLLGALALAALVPTRGRAGRGLWWQAAGRRAWWWLAVLGLAASGLSMIGVVVTGTEPPSGLVTAEVLIALVGMVGSAVTGVRAGTWPWPVGLGVALYLPIMFLVPLNAAFMALVWIGVAAAARRRTWRAGTTHPAVA